MKLRDEDFLTEFPADPRSLPPAILEGLYEQDPCAEMKTQPADMAAKYFVPLRGKPRRE